MWSRPILSPRDGTYYRGLGQISPQLAKWLVHQVSMWSELVQSEWVLKLSLFPWWFQMVKHLSAMQDTQVQSLGWENPLEKEMATHSSILAWKIPWTVEPGRLLSMGSQRVGHYLATSFLLLNPIKVGDFLSYLISTASAASKAVLQGSCST